MVIGSITQASALMAMGGLGLAQNPSQQAGVAITAMTTLFGAGFNFGFGPLSHVITAEVPTSRLRDMTYATASVFNIAISFAVTFSIPYLLYEPYAALGSRVGFIFGSMSVLAIVFTIFCLPECKVGIRCVFSLRLYRYERTAD